MKRHKETLLVFFCVMEAVICSKVLLLNSILLLIIIH